MDGVSIHFIKATDSSPFFYKGLEFLFVFNGEIMVRLDEKENITLSSDQLLVLDSHTLRAYSGNGENSTAILRLSEDFLRRNCEEFLHCDIFYSSLENSRMDLDFQIKRLFSQMIVQYIQNTKLEFLSYLFHLLFLLHRDFSSPHAKSSESENGTADKDFYMLLDYLNEHYYERLSLEKAAGLVYKSPQAFSKYFKRNAGVGFLEYLSRIRVERALTDLLSTDHTITQIAADCGFVNDHAFTLTFRKAFGQTPGAYRQKFRKPASNSIDGDPHLGGIPFECETLRELIRFSQKEDSYTASGIHGSKPLPVTVSVSCAKKPHGFNFFKIIILENGLEYIGNTTVLQQLRTIQKTLVFDYVCLNAFDLTLFSQNCSILYEHDFAFGDHAVRSFLADYAALQLTPYIRLDLSYLRQIYHNDLILYYKRFSHFIRILNECPNIYKTKKIRFELCCSNAADQDSFAPFCRRIFFLSGKFHFKEIGIGIASWMLSKAERSFCDSLKDFPFSFAAGEFLPLQERASIEQDLCAAQKCFFEKQFAQIQTFLAYIHSGEIPIYAIRWNVLSGSCSAEIGTFFRSAIILDTLAQFGRNFEGIGFPCQTLQFGHPANELALFLIRNVRRPVYFVLEVINALSHELLFQSSQTIVAKKSPDQYSVALFCPNYVNPALSIDHFFVERTVRDLQLNLKDLPNGFYKIKRFIYSKDSSGVYEHGRKLGVHDNTDPDVLNYLETAIQPDLYLYQTEISDGTLLLQAEISFNGIVLFLIERDIYL